ncbi:MAG: thiamine phosphate synthase, partial [Bacteroidota bacterium]|nr:thiamine phosphate synthase [Bacteroidota bacterium]
YDIGKKFEIIRFEIYDLELKVAKIKKMNFRKEIYAITNENLSGMTHLEMAYLLLENGIKIIQYRDKEKIKKEKLKDCFEIKKLVDNYSDVTFIVNDDVDIAYLVNADGVHLGQDDLDIKIVKEKFPSFIVGISTHNIEQVENAIKNGADYIGVGPIFNTNTKIGVEKSDGLKFLKWVKDNIEIPYVAIGGINRYNINDVFKYGGNTVAMISELFTDEKIKEIKLEFIRRQNDIYNSDGCS